MATKASHDATAEQGAGKEQDSGTLQCPRIICFFGRGRCRNMGTNVLNIQMSLQGDINLDRFTVAVECPRCGFENSIRLKQARLRDVVICRGCKVNVQLDDGMNSVRKVRWKIQRSMRDLTEAIERLNRG